MSKLRNPTYKRYITGEIPRFDERNTAFSRNLRKGKSGPGDTKHSYKESDSVGEA